MWVLLRLILKHIESTICWISVGPSHVNKLLRAPQIGFRFLDACDGQASSIEQPHGIVIIFIGVPNMVQPTAPKRLVVFGCCWSLNDVKCHQYISILSTIVMDVRYWWIIFAQARWMSMFLIASHRRPEANSNVESCPGWLGDVGAIDVAIPYLRTLPGAWRV